MNNLVEFIDAVAWPSTVLIIVLMFSDQIKEILQRFKRADFPGGVSFEAFPEKVKEVVELSVKVEEEESKKDKKDNAQVASIPLNEVNTRMINLGLSPSPTGLELSYYQILAEQDPNLSLAGLRMETEIMLRNLAKGFDVQIEKYDGVDSIIRKLKLQGAITYPQADLLSQLTHLCNSAIHGQRVTESQVKDLLGVAYVLRDQYVSWLSWGWDKVK